MTTLVEEDLKNILPVRLAKSVSQEVVDRLNEILSDQDAAMAYRENLLSYVSVLKDGKFKMMDYVNAVKYASLKIMGDSNFKAYIKTFPDRYADMKGRGLTDDQISPYVSAYHKGKLVTSILEQAQVPVWLLNQDAVQQAINTQVHLMQNAKSEMVRMQAANSVLTHLKRPDVAKAEIDITVKEDTSLTAIREASIELARQQQEALQRGDVSVRELGKEVFTVEGEYTHED